MCSGWWKGVGGHPEQGGEMMNDERGVETKDFLSLRANDEKLAVSWERIAKKQ